MTDIDDLLGSGSSGGDDAGQFAIGDAPVEIKVVIGTAMLRVRDLLKLGRGAVVELDRHLKDPTDVYVEGVRVRDLLKLGRGAVVELDRHLKDPTDVYVEGVLVARGEVVIVDDKIGVTLTDFIKSSREWKR